MHSFDISVHPVLFLHLWYSNSTALQVQERGDTTTDPVLQRILVSPIAQTKSTDEHWDAFCH